MITVSCIIPAHNEAGRIGRVLDVVQNHPLLLEIIVVDDGSGDNTAQVAQGRGIRVISLPENRGKSYAVAEGIAVATGSHLLMLDADLVGLNDDDITALIRPVMQHQADVTISLRRNSPWVWRFIGLDYISGERVFARGLVAKHLGRSAGCRISGWKSGSISAGLPPDFAYRSSDGRALSARIKPLKSAGGVDYRPIYR